MNERSRAIAILKQLRDILADRLSERICDLRAELLEEAMGLGYKGEIEAAYEQLGTRLQHVNSMLSQLPPVDEVPLDEIREDLEGSAPPGENRSSGQDSSAGAADSARRQAPLQLPASFDVETETDAESAEHALEASRSLAPRPATALEPVSFAAFVQQVQRGHQDAACRSLAELLDLQLPRARKCAEKFQQSLEASPAFLAKAMSLRQELRYGRVNASLMLLWECFGLQGPEAIAVMQKLKARFGV